jgi:hypothetical protein
MKAVDSGPDEEHLRDALRALARAEEAQAAPPSVEQAVMRHWQPVRAPRGIWQRVLIARRPMMPVAASLVLGVAVGVWWMRGRVDDHGVRLATVDVADTSSSYSYDMLTWLDPNPDSLQIVRLRVASETLRRQGYAVSDHDGDGTVEVEMVLGSDGMARSVLVTSETPVN